MAKKKLNLQFLLSALAVAFPAATAAARETFHARDGNSDGGVEITEAEARKIAVAGLKAAVKALEERTGFEDLLADLLPPAKAPKPPKGGKAKDEGEKNDETPPPPAE